MPCWWLKTYIVFVLCDKSIAAVALVFVVVGDPVAGMVGERWGRLRASSGKRFGYGLGGKSLEGSFACFAACLVDGVALAVVAHVALCVVVLGVICATVMESLTLPVNDNLSIPLGGSWCYESGSCHYGVEVELSYKNSYNFT